MKHKDILDSYMKLLLHLPKKDRIKYLNKINKIADDLDRIKKQIKDDQNNIKPFKKD